MPKETIIKCDCGCNTVRQQSNNWIQAQIEDASFKSWKWDDKRANRKGILFLATEECAHKLYSRWLASRTHKPQNPEYRFGESGFEIKTEGEGNENQGEVQAGEAVGR